MNGHSRMSSYGGAALMTVVLAAAGAAWAQPSQKAGLDACARIERHRARLNCYDRLARGEGPVAQPSAGRSDGADSPRKPDSVSGNQDAESAGKAAAPAVKAEPAAKPAPPSANAGPVAKPAPAANLEPAPQAESARASFGLGRKERTLGKISVTVVNVQKTYYGGLIFTTEDGQVWKQTGSQKPFVAEPPFAATIERGTLDSYFLKARDGRGAIRVIRQR